MASMRELFPLYDYKKKAQKNFIRENIKKVKGCHGCFLEKKILKMDDFHEKNKIEKSSGTKHSTGDIRTKVPAIKYNVKIIKRDNSPRKTVQIERKNVLSEINDNKKNLTNHSCQTDVNRLEENSIMSINCTTCGQAINRKTVALQTSVEKDQNSDKTAKKVSTHSKESNQTKKKDSQSKKTLDLSSYKMGVVPKYLKERNAKVEQEQKEKSEQEKLAELRGLNDPRCPPGHMLMPKTELQQYLEEMETEFNGLIRQLNMMPVSSDSYRVKQRKIQIEKELKELEEKIELFKKGKVFVQIPS